MQIQTFSITLKHLFLHIWIKLLIVFSPKYRRHINLLKYALFVTQMSENCYRDEKVADIVGINVINIFWPAHGSYIQNQLLSR